MGSNSDDELILIHSSFTISLFYFLDLICLVQDGSVDIVTYWNTRYSGFKYHRLSADHWSNWLDENGYCECCGAGNKTVSPYGIMIAFKV